MGRPHVGSARPCPDPAPPHNPRHPPPFSHDASHKAFTGLESPLELRLCRALAATRQKPQEDAPWQSSAIALFKVRFPVAKFNRVPAHHHAVNASVALWGHIARPCILRQTCTRCQVTCGTIPWQAISYRWYPGCTAHSEILWYLRLHSASTLAAIPNLIVLPTCCASV